MWKIRIAAGCIGLLLAASAAAELRTYDVDFKYQQEVHRALVSILHKDPAIAGPAGLSYGQVQLLPTGQIVVDTSPETHAQIEELLAEIRARQTDATPRVTLRYWVVLGTNVEEAPGDAPAPILNDVLAELRRVHGDLTFRVLGTATLVTESGQQGEVKSAPLGATQGVYVRGQTASAAIRLRYVEPRPIPLRMQDQPGFLQTIPDPYVGDINLNVTLERGEFLVLGESTVQTFQLKGTLFYIVHWPASE
jgi:hypothetical protein